MAALIGADPQEIVFTSCGTESDNAAIWGTLNSYPQKNHIITTRVEHPAVGNLATYLSKKGYTVNALPVDREGRLDLEQLASAISDQTALVSIMWANNETGVIFPWRRSSNWSNPEGWSFIPMPSRPWESYPWI